jgi:glycosyltransferase involved in cell wall biosynthesis
VQEQSYLKTAPGLPSILDLNMYSKGPTISVVSSIPGLVPEFGGPSRSNTALCSALAGAGVQVKLLSLDFGKKFKAPIFPSSQKVQTHLVPCHASKKLRVQWAPEFKQVLRSLLNNTDQKVIHDNGLWSFTNHATATVARERGVPLVLSTRGMLTPWAIKYKALKKWLGWHLFQHRNLLTASLFHATSPEEAEGIRQLGLRQPIAIIPNGVVLPETWAEEVGQGKTALFLGRVHPVKGLLPLVEAWSRVRPKGWRMIIAGPDEENHQADVQAALQRAGLSAQFHFAGLVDGQAKTRLFREADLFILPSYSENFSMAVAEALAHGLPVLTTKGTPWKELPARNCGWWVDVSVDGLAGALEEATRVDACKLREMGQEGRRLVEERFSWEKIGVEMRSVYEWILGVGPKPACVVSC